MTPYDNLSRIEIIGPNGREFVAYYEPGAMLDVQDDGRTLKVFVGERRAGTVGDWFGMTNPLWTERS
jgi:hypothetical protein